MKTFKVGEVFVNRNYLKDPLLFFWPCFRPIVEKAKDLLIKESDIRGYTYIYKHISFGTKYQSITEETDFHPLTEKVCWGLLYVLLFEPKICEKLWGLKLRKSNTYILIFKNSEGENVVVELFWVDVEWGLKAGEGIASNNPVYLSFKKETKT